MTNTLGFVCEVCGEDFPLDLPEICAHCHVAICQSCMHGQGDEGEGHEQAEHGNELRHERRGRHSYDWQDDDEY